MSNKWLLLIVLGISLATHFAFFGNPNQTVFDEVHFGKFISGYYTHEYYFDIHPPLGKLMIAGFAKIFDFQPEFSFTEIGAEFPDKKYLALRFLPAVAGTLLPVVIFLLALQIGISKVGSFAAGLLVVFENAFLTQSRFILLDPFLLLFGFTSFLFYLKSRRQSKHNSTYSQILKNLGIKINLNWDLFWMAVFAGLAVSIKWTGLTFLALPFFIELFQIYKQKEFKQIFKLPVYFFIIPFVLYFSVFVVHFSLLTKPGSGDAFMSSGFHNKNILKKFVELNVEMYRSNQRLTATHPYSSQWYSWPFMARPIFYWVSDNSRIYLLGNPVIWWASTVAIVISLWTMVYKLWLKFRKHSELSSIVYNPLAFLLGGYFLNLLPFIGIKRVMFLYHYLTGLVFAILILVYFIEKQDGSTWLTTRKIFIGLAIASTIAFIYFAPLTYGLPLSPKAYEARVWLQSWR